MRTISTADTWYFPSHGFGLLGGVWPDLTLWFAVALARNGFATSRRQWLEAIYAAMEAGAARNTVPGEFAEWFDGGSLTNRGMYLSPWTGAKYLWAVAETVCGLDGYRTSGRPHFAPHRPRRLAVDGRRCACTGARGRCTYVIDARRKLIFGDMREASAEEPYRCIYAGHRRQRRSDDLADRGRSGRVRGRRRRGARFPLQPDRRRARPSRSSSAAATVRRRVEAGAMLEVTLAGQPLDTRGAARRADVAGCAARRGAGP